MLFSHSSHSSLFPNVSVLLNKTQISGYNFFRNKTIRIKVWCTHFENKWKGWNTFCKTQIIGRSKGVLEMHPSSRCTTFFRFHSVFNKILLNNRLAHPLWGWCPCFRKFWIRHYRRTSGQTHSHGEPVSYSLHKMLKLPLCWRCASHNWKDFHQFISFSQKSPGFYLSKF